MTEFAAADASKATGVAQQEAGSAEIQVQMRNLTRRFGPVTAVAGVDLDIPKGRIVALLGPSGCGKTTLLRMAAGLESPDGGQIVMGGRVLADASTGKHVPPEKRNIGMVFQSYAVWPHMTVAQNVGFPLKMRRVGKQERDRRVANILEVTGLSSYADRPATKLSGGQQQRVALARALVYTPDLLLLDEPLSNLDAALRIQMRREIRRLNHELGVTMLFVTHDQDEALSVADHVAVLSDGHVEQFGRPAELYEEPKTPFVRDFVGHRVPLDGIYERRSDTAIVVLDDGTELEGFPVRDDHDVVDGARVKVHFRPEDVHIVGVGGEGAAHPHAIKATVQSASYLGDRMEYVVDLRGSSAVITGPGHIRHSEGDVLLLEVDAARAGVWPA